MGAIGLDEPSGGGAEEGASGGGTAGAAGRAILTLSPPTGAGAIGAGAAMADAGTAMGAGAAITGTGDWALPESCWEISWLASGVPSTPQTGQLIAWGMRPSTGSTSNLYFWPQ